MAHDTPRRLFAEFARFCNKGSVDSTGVVGEARRRGRPQRLPDDPVPLSSKGLTVEHRVGWLLATTRILHPDDELRNRAGFTAAATALGLRVDSTRISRWETGTSPATSEVIRTYESVLGRPPGSLSAVVGGLRRSFSDGLGSRAAPGDRRWAGRRTGCSRTRSPVSR